MEEKGKICSITVVHNGPLIVNNEFMLIDKDGKESLQQAKVALCRCGHSHKKPFCDGTHKIINFDDTADN
ncbi:MAG: CDGSH iron-sulfur domain-containing protein [Marinifilaceae bacterium]